MRERWSSLLAAQDGVRRARGGTAQLFGCDPLDVTCDRCLLEDRLRELGPCAIPCRCDVPDAKGPRHELPNRLREVPDVGWGGALVVDDGDLVERAAEP